MSMPQPPSPSPALPQARRPRGFADRAPADLAATEAMLGIIRQVYARYGFDALETPFLEYTDALGKFLPDQDRPNAGVFSLRDDDEQWLSLRYDLTAPLARYVAENWQHLPKPFRSYRAGWVFRNEKPGPGRFRQFMQFDADTVGAPSIAADAEICMMAADTLEALGLARGAYVIRVNNRKILDGVMAAIGLGAPEEAPRRLIVLRAIDKLDKFSREEVAKLLGAGRLDESGDFTKGAGLDMAAITALFEALEAKIGVDDAGGLSLHMGAAATKAGIAGHPLVREGYGELAELATFVRAAGYDADRILLDPSVIRGLEYYTGPVYEAELLFEIKDEDGRPVRFGSVGGGGRYDGLVSRFLGESVPATGFSIGVSRLLSALQALGKAPKTAENGPVLVLAMDRDGTATAAYTRLVQSLRAAGIRAELYLGSAGMKAQMKYADRRGCSIALIQGSNEREKGVVQIKDLALGAQLQALAKADSSARDRSDYLEKQAQAQREVPLEAVIPTLKDMLAQLA